jgi:uncharacterized protein (DUF1778 family)
MLQIGNYLLNTSSHLDLYGLRTDNLFMNASTRAERIEIRATLELKASLEKAAQLHDQTLSAFVLSASRDAAARVLGDQTRFTLSAKQMTEFHKALDAPARDLPGLKRLFAKPSVFS